MNITSLFNPYSYIAAAVVLASIGGTMYYQSTQIHHYHKMYDADEVKIGVYVQREKEGTVVANTQKTKTTDTITKIIAAPAPPVIKVIKEAPIPQDCSTPAIDELRNNT